jgi:hypothetical protein
MFVATSYIGGRIATVTNTVNVDGTGPSTNISPGVNTYTVASAALGTPIDNSIVAVLADIYSNGTNPVIQSISIDGTNGTLLQSGTTSNGSTFDVGTAIVWRATSSTSGNIVVSADNGFVRARIQVFRLNKLVSAAASDSKKTGSTGAGAISVNLSVPRAGIIIAGGATLNPSDASVPTLSGITQAGNGVLALNLYKYCYGYVQAQSLNASRAITVTPNASALGSSMVAASWS